MDAALLALPHEAAGIELRPLYDEAFRVLVPAGHPLARHKRIEASALDPAELLLVPVGHCFRDQVLEACREFTRPPPPGRRGNSLETLRSMVASGLGITVLPATALVERYANPLLKSVAFAEPQPRRRVALAWRRGFHRGAALEALAGAIRSLDLPVRPL